MLLFRRKNKFNMVRVVGAGLELRNYFCTYLTMYFSIIMIFIEVSGLYNRFFFFFIYINIIQIRCLIHARCIMNRILRVMCPDS